MSEREIPLEAVEGWSPAHVAKLKESWIVTAQQAVAIAATPEGVASLASQLGISQMETERLIELARRALPAHVASRVGKPADTTGFGLGAMLPPKKTPEE
jgi:hypothetical protein